MLALDDQAGVDEVLEVTADGRDGEAELLGQRRRGHGSALADRLQDPVARARLEHLGRFGDIHNVDVT